MNPRAKMFVSPKTARNQQLKTQGGGRANAAGCCRSRPQPCTSSTGPILLDNVNVAVIGAGHVGLALASRLARNTAAKVTLGARDVAKTRAAVSAAADHSGTALAVALVADAVAAADVVVLAVPGAHDDAGIRAIAASLGDASGKVVIDATNPLSGFTEGLSVRWGGDGTSGGEVLAAAIPGAAVYKARSHACMHAYPARPPPVPVPSDG
jgi:predicted dinucleotide-binding enzyme